MNLTTPSSAAPSPEQIRAAGRTATSVALAWGAAASVLALTGLLSVPPRPFIPLAIWGSVAAFLVCFVRLRAFRAWLLTMDLRGAIAFHVVRVVFGAAFIATAARGAMPHAFADVAGPGDIAAGLLALPAAACIPMRTRARRVAVFAWNSFALLDILVVFANAQRLLFFHPGLGLYEAFASNRLFALIPIFVVPMVLITHFVVYAQLWQTRTSHASLRATPA